MYEIVVATDEEGLIGIGDKLPWKCKEEMEHFKLLTQRNVVFMGRRTFDSIGKALPNRINYVFCRGLHRQGKMTEADRLTDSNRKNKHKSLGIEETIELACFKSRLSKTERNFVIGGKSIYEELIPGANFLHLSIIKGKFKTGTNEDVFLKIDMSEWELVVIKEHEKFTYKKYKRRVK